MFLLPLCRMFKRILEDNVDPLPGEKHLAALTAGERFNNHIKVKNYIT